MNRIVDEANRVKNDVLTNPNIVCHDVVNVCTRTIMLEKAYRYQKVAKILAHCERMFEARGDKRRRQRCTYKGSVYSSKAAKLYKQATTV